MRLKSIIKLLLVNIILCIGFNVFAQNVGINTATPLRSFHINSGSLLITGDTGTIPNLGAGAKFFWSPALSAFRAGTTTGKEWDYDSLGMYSFAYGRGTKANGGFSMAGGNYSSASKQSSFSFGNQVQVSGDYSAGFGSLNSVTGTHSFTVGGDNDADGNYSVAFGRGSTANSYGSLVIGRWNNIEDGASGTSWVSTDPAFVIGNGSANTQRGRGNAFSVAKNGNMEVAGNAYFGASATIDDSLTVSDKIKVVNSMSIGEFGKLTSLHVGGGVSLKNYQVSFVPNPNAYGSNVEVGNKSYIKLVANSNSGPSPYNVILGNGVSVGQILIISGGRYIEQYIFKDDYVKKLALTSDHVLNHFADTLVLIWNGAQWVELFFSDVD